MGTNDLTTEESIRRANEKWAKGKPPKRNNWQNRHHAWKTADTEAFNERNFRKRIKDEK